jgi:hypothetical protein
MTVSKELLSAIEKSRVALVSNQRVLEKNELGISIEFWGKI